MRDRYCDIVFMLNEALSFSKYLTTYDGEYKKDKKVVKKMIDDLEKGNFQKYMKEEMDDEDE